MTLTEELVGIMATDMDAIAMLEGLPKGWGWSISKYGEWYHVVINNDGLLHEPVYTNAGMSPKQPKRGFVSLNTPESRDMGYCIRFAYAEYEKGEAAQRVLREQKKVL